MAKAPIEIRSLARKHTDEAIERLVYWMRSDSKHSVYACIALLDRGWGKPAQTIEVSGEITNKVIRAPAIASSIESWSDEHVPQQHRTEH